MTRHIKTQDTTTRTKRIDGYEVQRLLPMGFPYFGMEFLDAEFRRYPTEPDTWYVEAQARIGTITHPYTIVLTLDQAREADIIERI